MTFIALALLSCMFGMPRAAAQERLDGTWAGGISFSGWYPIRVHFKTEPQRIQGVVYPDGYNQPGQTLRGVRLAGSGLHFEWEEGDGLAVFDGTLRDGTITGEFEQNKQKGIFRLARVAGNVDLQAFSQYHGLYQTEPGQFIWIGRASELRRQPSFIDTRSGRFGILYPSSEVTFFSGSSAFAPFPTDIRLMFVKDEKGEATRLIWQMGDSVPISAPRVKLYEEEEVKFQNGTVTLSGTLVKPSSRGPHPAVVLIHGSGGQGRWYFSSLPYILAARGVAALVYDKRGVGGSTGNRHTSTFADLADDAIAGVSLLKNRKDINPQQIGVWGHSQGGWVGPLAASRSKDIAFVITAAGASVSVDQQIMDQIAFNLREAGFSEADTQEALSHMNLYFAVRDRREPWAKLEASVRNVETKTWGRFVWRPKSEKEVLSDTFEVYDPAATLRQTKVPVLALFGGLDEKVPPENNAKRMEEFLRQAGNTNFTIKVFPKADHDFIEVEAMGRKGYLNRKGYIPGYFNTIVEWILKRVEVAK
jgi:pimeloyl-ACP methyl ester carboxylesterase